MAAVGEGDRGLKASGEFVAMAGELIVGELSAAVVIGSARWGRSG
jgi:hypothetical protein